MATLRPRSTSLLGSFGHPDEAGCRCGRSRLVRLIRIPALLTPAAAVGGYDSRRGGATAIRNRSSIPARDSVAEVGKAILDVIAEGHKSVLDLVAGIFERMRHHAGIDRDVELELEPEQFGPKELIKPEADV